MEGNITFYTYDSTLELNGRQFDAGTLTEDLLNLSPDDYHPMHERMKRITELERSYARGKQRSVWWELNEEMVALCQNLRSYLVFQLLLDEHEDRYFSVVREVTEQRSLFPSDESRPSSETTVQRLQHFFDNLLQRKEQEEEEPKYLDLFDPDLRRRGHILPDAAGCGRQRRHMETVSEGHRTLPGLPP